MAEHTLINARPLSSLAGKAPRTFGQGRVCNCGTKLSQHNDDTKCSSCTLTPGRAAAFPTPQEHNMEPENLHAKKAADFLEVTPTELKKIVADGHLEPYKVGRGPFGTKYLKADLEALKLQLVWNSHGALVRVDTGEPAAILPAIDPAPPIDQSQHDPVAERIAAETGDGPLELATKRASLIGTSWRVAVANDTGLTVDEVVTLASWVPNGDESEAYYSTPEGWVIMEGWLNDGHLVRHEACVTETVKLEPCRDPEHCAQGGTCNDDPTDTLSPDTIVELGTDAGDLLEAAWGVIANANTDDWNDTERDKTDWRVAAERFRDGYHRWLDEPKSAEADAPYSIEYEVGPAMRRVDPEAGAINDALDVLGEIDQAGQARVIGYLINRFDLAAYFGFTQQRP